jgi:hypothetical protein
MAQASLTGAAVLYCDLRFGKYSNGLFCNTFMRFSAVKSFSHSILVAFRLLLRDFATFAGTKGLKALLFLVARRFSAYDSQYWPFSSSATRNNSADFWNSQ